MRKGNHGLGRGALRGRLEVCHYAAVDNGLAPHPLDLIFGGMASAAVCCTRFSLRSTCHLLEYIWGTVHGNYGWGTVHGNYRRDFYRLGGHFLLVRGIRPPARISPRLDIQGVRVP